MACPSVSLFIHNLPFIQSVSSPDEGTPGLLQGDPAFCSQGAPYQIVPISVLEILKGENLFPPELYDL